ncbi:MAG: hypothetical protein Q4G10_02525 [Bacteroidia bacterium]|nr:hypothetical protein [Bacteroidia bacterium]
MKRFTILTIVAALLILAFPAVAGAQARINTKRVRIADISTRTTKVVLGGNDITDSALKEEVSARWRISPYEFCTSEEYNSIKESTDYYFLLIARSTEKKYDGILTLTLMKGGKYGAQDPMMRPVDVVSLPFCSTQFPSGREMAFLPAFLDIIQDYASKAAISDKAGYAGLEIYTKKIARTGHKKILFCEDDAAPVMDPVFRRKHFDEDMMVVDEGTADGAIVEGTYNTLVSFTVAPFDPQAGSVCYKMLVDAGSHELYYFKRHKISAKKWAGFLPKDIKVISAAR